MRLPLGDSGTAMLALLVALQMTTTNCYRDSAGGLHCSSMTPPQMPSQPYANTDWYALFKARQDRKRSEAVGKMLAKGDCQGALNYALERGDFGLVAQVKSYCGGK